MFVLGSFFANSQLISTILGYEVYTSSVYWLTKPWISMEDGCEKDLWVFQIGVPTEITAYETMSIILNYADKKINDQNK